MRRNLVTSRGSQPHCEQSLLVWITSQHRQFRPRRNPGGASPHFKSAGLRTTCCPLVADSVDFLDASFFSAATAASESTKGITSIKEIFFHSFLRWLNNRYQFPRSAQFRGPTSVRGHRLTEDYRWQPFFNR